MPGPFGDYVNKTYLGLPPGADDPLDTSNISLTVFRDAALKHAGWTDEARDWASSVPMTMSEPGRGFEGAYTPAINTVQLTRYPDERDADYSQTLEHEMQHAWDEGHNGYLPSRADYDRVTTQDLHNPLAWLKGLNPTWGGRGEAQGSPPADPDKYHHTQALFDAGFGPNDLPDWYRTTYLGQYKR